MIEESGWLLKRLLRSNRKLRSLYKLHLGCISKSSLWYIECGFRHYNEVNFCLGINLIWSLTFFDGHALIFLLDARFYLRQRFLEQLVFFGVYQSVFREMGHTDDPFLFFLVVYYVLTL